MPQTLPIHCITGETFPFDWNQPRQANCIATDHWVAVQTPSGASTTVTQGSTPNAAVLCDINGTPQWCHDGTNVIFAQVSVPPTKLGPFEEGFQAGYQGFAFATGLLTIPLLVGLVVTAISYTLHRAYFTKPSRRK